MATVTENKKIHIALDDKSFKKLDKIKKRHGDTTYTQAIKRAIALLEFIDTQNEEGVKVYLADDKGDKVKELFIAA